MEVAILKHEGCTRTVKELYNVFDVISAICQYRAVHHAFIKLDESQFLQGAREYGFRGT